MREGKEKGNSGFDWVFDRGIIIGRVQNRGFTGVLAGGQGSSKGFKGQDLKLIHKDQSRNF